MSVNSVKGKGWRYDFTLMGTRYNKGWFKTKIDAQAAVTYRSEEVKTRCRRHGHYMGRPKST